MSDLSEKPFEATAHRIAKAKREGNVARSSELAANFSFAAGAAALVAIAPTFGAVVCVALRTSPHNGPAAVALIPGVALLAVSAAALGAVVGNVFQNGRFVSLAITAKPERLNPFEGVKRMLSRETLAHSLRAILAFGCAGAAMVPLVALSASAFLHASTLDRVVAAAWTTTREIAVAACAVGICFSIAEFGAARRQWLRKLRMSFDERRRETKDEEGDPGARTRRRALHRALLRGGMRRLKDAAFVVTNPTHVAVALEYRPVRVPVPRVLLRAADAAAIRVRAVASSYRIPIVENASLARALYRDARAGEPIPHAHYLAVAQVVVALLRSREIVDR